MKKIDYVDFGVRLRKLRRQQGFTQDELAQAVGISTSFLGHLERGSRIPSMETLCMLCNTLKVFPRYFLDSGLDDGLMFTPPELLDEERRYRLSQLLRQADRLLTEWELRPIPPSED